MVILVLPFTLLPFSLSLPSQQILAWTNPTHAPVHTILSLLRDRCVLCLRGGGVCLAGTFPWAVGNGETAEEGRELVALGGKQIFANTSPDVGAFPNACIKCTWPNTEKQSDTRI